MGLVSCWPIGRSEVVSLAGIEKDDEGLVLFAEVDGPRGAGHPVHSERIGDAPVDGVWASDHFGVVADLRY